MAAVGALALWTLAASGAPIAAHDKSESSPAAGASEARGGSDATPAPLQEGQQAPTEAPGPPELDAAPAPPGACPDRGRKLELIV